jgi:hypothetical protein
MKKNRGAHNCGRGIVEKTSGYTTNTKPGPVARKHKHTIEWYFVENILEINDTSGYSQLKQGSQNIQ